MAPKRKQADGGKGKKFFKVKKQEEDSENEVEASEESNAENEEDEVSIPEEGGDGLADMMSKILHQNIGTKVCEKAGCIMHPDLSFVSISVISLGPRSSEEKDRFDERY